MCGGRQLQNVMLIAVLNSLMFLAYNETGYQDKYQPIL